MKISKTRRILLIRRWFSRRSVSAGNLLLVYFSAHCPSHFLFPLSNDLPCSATFSNTPINPASFMCGVIRDTHMCSYKYADSTCLWRCGYYVMTVRGRWFGQAGESRWGVLPIYFHSCWLRGEREEYAVASIQVSFYMADAGRS